MANDAIGFRNCVIENTRDVFLGQGHFEEVVDFQRNEASPVYSVKLLMTHDDGGLDQQTHHQTDLRRMTVISARDPVVVLADGTLSTWSAVTGQVFSPGLGNLFERADGSRWSWKRVHAEDFASWTLTFESSVIYKSGGRPMGI